MPIAGRSLHEVGGRFASHLTALLANTITTKPLILATALPGQVMISFRDHGNPSTAPLRTKYGLMDLYISQFCDAVESNETGKVNLRTVAYIYTLRPRTMPEPLFRWEYVRFPEPDEKGNIPQWCRHHIQGDIKLTFTDDRGAEHQLPLNDWHTPTGWIPLEEVIRFCIVDLGVRAKSGWEQVLEESYQKFDTEFSI